MPKIKKLRAYTLAEIIVVVILTSIVVGLAFSILNLIQKQMLGAQKNYEMHSELNQLKQSLWIDLHRYPITKYNNTSQSLTFSSEVDSIRYSFHDGFIVKDIDTFDLNINSKTFFYKSNEVSSGVIDAIKLSLFKDKEPTLFIYKQNDATASMN